MCCTLTSSITAPESLENIPLQISGGVPCEYSQHVFPGYSRERAGGVGKSFYMSSLILSILKSPADGVEVWVM